jgi:hypothetical protein
LPDEPERGLKRSAEHLELNNVYLSNINSGEEDRRQDGAPD